MHGVLVDCTRLSEVAGLLTEAEHSPCQAMSLIGHCAAARILSRLGMKPPRGLLAAAITSPKGGSSLREPSVEDRGGDSPSLWGEKVFVTNGLRADWYIVYGEKGGEPALFLVERGADGLVARPMGLAVYQCSGIARLEFRGVAATLLERGRRARDAVVHGLSDSRVLVAALAVGLGRSILAKAYSWAVERGVLGKQAVAHRLAAAAAELEAALALVEKTIARIEDGVAELWESSAAKYVAVEAALGAARAARRTLGGYAYQEDGVGLETRSLELHIKGLEPAEGTQDIQLEIIARKYFRRVEEA